MTRYLALLGILAFLLLAPSSLRADDDNTVREPGPVASDGKAKEQKEQPDPDLAEIPASWSFELAYSHPTYGSYSPGLGRLITDPGDAISGRLEFFLLRFAGKLGIGLGSAFYRLVNEPIDAAQTVFASIYTVPIEAFVAYHADFFVHQFVVPYVRLGAEYTIVRQTSATGAEVSGYRYYKGFDIAVGGQLGLNWIEPDAAKSLYHSCGINDTYLTVEYFKSTNQSSGSPPDLTRHEIRFALRFEF